MVHSLLIRVRKGLAHDIIDTFATHAIIERERFSEVRL